MTTRNWGIAATVVAMVLSAIFGSLQSVTWNGIDAPDVARALTSWLDPGLLLESASSQLAQPTESYFGYGRLVVALYGLLLIAGLPMRSIFPRRLLALAILLIALAVIGDVVAYWVSESAGPGVRRIGFWYMEFPALALLVVLLMGVAALRLRHQRSGGVLIVSLPLTVAATALLGYLPHGILLGLAATLLLALVAWPGRDTVSLPDAGRPARSVVTAIGIATVLGVVILVSMYRPTLRRGPQNAPRSLLVSEKLTGSRLHVFNTGRNRMSWFLVGRDRPWRPVPAFVVELSNGGLFVFDTGLSDAVAELGEAGLPIPERWVMESRSVANLTLPEQMREAGLAPNAVHLVGVSHLHADHVGQLAAFPNAQIIGGPGSEAFAQNTDLVDQWREQAFETTKLFGPFEGAVDTVGDQRIVLLRGGGHAIEGLMLLIALDEGPVLLAGDAVVHSDWLRSSDVQRIAIDAERAAVVRNQVRLFLDTVPNSSVAYGHDLRGIDCGRRDIVCHRSDGFYPEGG